MRTISLLFALLLSLIACSSAAPTPTLSAQQIAQESADKSASINTFHFTIDLAGRPKTIDPLATLILRHADGDVARPDRAKSKIKVALTGFIVEIQAIGIGDKQWLTNPLSQRWEQAPANWGYNPAILFDKQHGISSLLNQVQGLERGADDTLDGKAHYRLTGRVASADVAPMTGYMVTGSEVSFVLWIGMDDFMLRKVHITEKDGADAEATDWDIMLSAFDQPVSIEPPPQ